LLPRPVVIASGVSAMPSERLVWRVVPDVAQPAGEAEAAFVPEAAIQRRASLDGQPYSYLRIGLAPPSDAEYTAGGDLVYANPSFDAPGGHRVVQLRSGSLEGAHDHVVPGTGSPTLVVVTSGEVLIGTEGDPVQLSAGKAIAFNAPLRIVGAGENGGRFVIAQIGDLVAGSGDEPAASGGIYLQVFACPPGVSYLDLPQAQDALLLRYERGRVRGAPGPGHRADEG
jgi:hypothetical protein